MPLNGNLIIAVTSVVIASAATFFITKSIFAKKPDIAANQTSIQKIENFPQNIESDIHKIKSEIDSIKSDINAIKTNTTKKKPQKFISKTTDDIQNGHIKKWLYDENNEKIKNFNKYYINLQQTHLNEQHDKNLESIINFLTDSSSENSVVHKINNISFQNILVEDYYETESNNVKTIFLPINSNDINKFFKNIKDRLNKKINPLKGINFGNKIKKENAKHIKKAIDAYCLKKHFKSTVNESLGYAKINHKSIIGFFISEYQLQNHTNNYAVSPLYY